MLCTLIVATRTVSVTCTLASLYHLFVVSGESYLAIKHSIAYETGLVTEARIMIASVLSWAGAVIILPIDFLSEANRQFMSVLTVFMTLFVLIPEETNRPKGRNTIYINRKWSKLKAQRWLEIWERVASIFKITPGFHRCFQLPLQASISYCFQMCFHVYQERYSAGNSVTFMLNVPPPVVPLINDPSPVRGI